MQRKWMFLTATVLLAWPMAVVAQEPEPPRPPRAPRTMVFSTSDNRGGIGEIVRTDTSPETDKIEANIEEESHGGPDDKEALKEGEIIKKLNSNSIESVPADDDKESEPEKKL